jgi:hypothetical protein
MTRSTLALIIGLAFPSGVLAQDSCPVVADLDHGIRVEMSDNTSEVYRAGGDGIVRLAGFEGGVAAFNIELGQGVHILKYETILDGTVEAGSMRTYDYGMPAADLPVPSAGGRWQGGAQVVWDDGARDETQSHAYGGETMIDIGGCPYRALDVLIAYNTEDAYIETLTYLPELGFAYLASSMADGAPIEDRQAIRITGLK